MLDNNLNDKIIEVFEEIADEYKLSDISKKQIIELLNNLAGGKGTESEKKERIRTILESIGKYNGN